MPLETCPICSVRLPRELLSTHRARAHPSENPLHFEDAPRPDGPPPPEAAYRGDTEEGPGEPPAPEPVPTAPPPPEPDLPVPLPTDGPSGGPPPPPGDAPAPESGEPSPEELPLVEEDGGSPVVEETAAEGPAEEDSAGETTSPEPQPEAQGAGPVESDLAPWPNLAPARQWIARERREVARARREMDGIVRRLSGGRAPPARSAQRRSRGASRRHR